MKKVVVYFPRCMLNCWSAICWCRPTKRYSNWGAFTWLCSAEVGRCSCTLERTNQTHTLNNQSKNDFNWKKNIVQMLMFRGEFIKTEMRYARIKWTGGHVCGNGSWHLHVLQPSANGRGSFRSNAILHFTFLSIAIYGKGTKHSRLADVYHNSKKGNINL